MHGARKTWLSGCTRPYGDAMRSKMRPNGKGCYKGVWSLCGLQCTRFAVTHSQVLHSFALTATTRVTITIIEDVRSMGELMQQWY